MCQSILPGPHQRRADPVGTRGPVSKDLFFPNIASSLNLPRRTYSAPRITLELKGAMCEYRPQLPVRPCDMCHMGKKIFPPELIAHFLVIEIDFLRRALTIE